MLEKGVSPCWRRRPAPRPARGESQEAHRRNGGRMARLALLICLHAALVTLEAGRVAGEDRRVWAAAGDFIIGGIFAIHEDVDKENASLAPRPQPCVRFQVLGLTRALAMINAIETVNKSPLLADANITLGYQILDSCSDVSTALRATADFTRPAHYHIRGHAPTRGQAAVAVIGASHSETSIAIARQLTLQMIPQISYSSTAVILSDKSRFPAFMRTVPSDRHQTAAMASLLADHGWTWVGVVTTDGDYGQSALEHFVAQASERRICVAFKSILPQSVTSQHVASAVSQTARTVLSNPKVKVIVSFVKPTHMMHLYKELKSRTLRAGGSLRSMRRVWVASDSWSSSVFGNVSLEDLGHVLGFTFKSGDLSSFLSYLDRLEAAGHAHAEKDPFMQELLLQLNASRAHTCDQLLSAAVQTLRERAEAGVTLSVEMAVSAIAQAVASVCRTTNCKTAGRVKPWEVLEALRRQEFSLREHVYSFDRNGDINLGYGVTRWRSDGGRIDVHQIVAEYQPQSNNFTNGTTGPQLQELQRIVSRCSSSCVPGEFKKSAEGQHTCCYECINCTENYYSNATDMDQCLSCDTSTQWSPAGSAGCQVKPEVFFSWKDGFAVVLLVFSGLGVLLTLLVAALFVRRWDTPVVKAAGGPLSQAILFSLLSSYVSAVLFVGQPGDLQCKARQVLFGLSFTLCVSCILVKSLQILLAFQFDPELQDVLKKLYRPYAIIGVCVGLQAVICICWLTLKGPSHQRNIKEKKVLVYCHEGSNLVFGVMLGYIALLAFVCFVCAFKGRKLPQRYNEAKFITFSMLLYLISWLLFVPVHVTNSGKYQPAVEMVVILISNYGILGCHFFPKCYVILCRRDQNTKSAFRKNLYEYSSNSRDSVSVWTSSASEQQPRGENFIQRASSQCAPAAPPACREEGHGAGRPPRRRISL